MTVNLRLKAVNICYGYGRSDFLRSQRLRKRVNNKSRSPIPGLAVGWLVGWMAWSQARSRLLCQWVRSRELRKRASVIVARLPVVAQAVGHSRRRRRRWKPHGKCINYSRFMIPVCCCSTVPIFSSGRDLLQRQTRNINSCIRYHPKDVNHLWLSTNDNGVTDFDTDC